MSGIPYMGSKRSIAKSLVSTMLSRHPDATHVYDLFGGGGAMSLEFARRGLQVTYNDKDRAIASLFRHLTTGGDLGEWATRWVSRDDFHELRLREDWVGGFVRSVWSFGNNHEKGYLYGPDIEAYKRAIHDAICHPDRVEGDEVHGVPLTAMEGCWSIDERRLAYVRAWRDVHDKKKDLMGGGSTSRHRAPRAHQPDPKNRGGNWNRGRSTQNESAVCPPSGMHCPRQQHAEAVRYIRKIGGGSTTTTRRAIDRPIVTHVGLSYDEVPTAGGIVYLDPPYEGTGEYTEGGIDYDELHAWVMDHDLPVYVSSYEWPRAGLTEIWAKEKIVSLQGGGANTAVERLFANPVAMRTATFGLVPP